MRLEAGSAPEPTYCHTFRATGITTYLMNDGPLETAQAIAGHESARTTGLHDRRDDEITLTEVERITGSEAKSASTTKPHSET